MITLLIVDDETIIRRGIHHHIDWKSNGIDVVGEAKNGEEGYQQALKLHPDIIITDIKMPRLSGIQMAEKIREVLPDIAIIFLTGYDEKEYLLSAIRFGISDYVMKSANSQNILDAVLRVKAKIQSREGKESGKLEDILNECLSSVKSSFLSGLFSGSLSEADIRKQASIFEFPVMGPVYIPVLAPLECLSEPDNLILTMLFQLNNVTPCICYQERQGILGFLNAQTFEAGVSALQKMTEHIKEKYPEFQLIYGRAAENFNQLSEGYGKLIRVSDGICWFPDRMLLPLEEVVVQEIPRDIFYIMESEVIHAYREKNTSEFIGKMEQFFAIAKKTVLPVESFRESLRRMVVSFETGSNAYQDACKILNVIDEIANPEKMFQYVQESFLTGMPGIVHNSIVRAAEEYIQKHYAQNIGLTEIANYCHVSPSYISKIFKDDIQIGIVQYLHNIRIEQAKRLLKNTDMRVTDIALEVGYADYKRFSLYFQKIVGISPRDYRKQGIFEA